MGASKRDIYASERTFKGLTFSDINVVRLLMEYRYKYDPYSGFESDATFDVAGAVSPVNVEIVATFASLDDLIEQCKFDETQLKIIKMTEEGYTLLEIAKLIGLSHGDNIKKRMNTICKEIVKRNLWNWRKVAFKNELGLKSKNCSKCKEELPATDEFFIYDSTNNNYKSACKMCK